MSDADDTSMKEGLIRLEAKIDVVLGRHEGRIDDLTRRQGETSSTLREQDARITANALTIAETRTNLANQGADLLDVRQAFSRSRSGTVAWVAVGVAALSTVLVPVLEALLK